MKVQAIKAVGLHSALAVAVVSAALAGCGSSSSEGGGGGAKILLNGGVGGAGATSWGGSGSNVYMQKQTGGGDLKMMSGGAANTAFTVATFTADTGVNAAVVSTGTVTPDFYTIPAAVPPAAPPPNACGLTLTTAAGKFYQVQNTNGSTNYLYISSGSGTTCQAADVVATGIQVAAGATLKLTPNYYGTARINLQNDVDNEGTITTLDANSTTRGNLYLRSSSYVGAGTIDTSGTATVPYAGNIDVNTRYSVVNSGKLNASGGDVTTGTAGDAGHIYLRSDRYTQNTAALTAHGGKSADVAGFGGYGNYIELYSNNGAVRNSGTIDTTGGVGATGGSAGSVYLDGYLGGTWNSGKIMAYGADSTVGNAGSGAYIEFYGYGGDIRNSADVLGYGGKTTAATGYGGSGNELYIYGEDTRQPYGCCSPMTPMGDVVWSGNIDLHGGDAVATGTGGGGSAGNLDAEAYGYGGTTASEMAFLGYAAINTYGGDGNFGGDASYVELYNYDTYLNSTTSSVPMFGGSVINQVKVDAHGGNAIATGAAANARGGRGGGFDLETDYYPTAALAPQGAMVVQTADVIKNGGTNRNTGTNSDGFSDWIWVWGYNGVNWTGNVTADGGNDIGTTGGTTGYGGRVSWLEWWSQLGAVTFNGNLSANGGDGAYRGGSHSGIDSYTAKVLWNGSITAKGGNAKPSNAGSIGGNGSWIEFKATDPVNSHVTGTITVTGGTGATAGSNGTVAGTLACVGTSC